MAQLSNVNSHRDTCRFLAKEWSTETIDIWELLTTLQTELKLLEDQIPLNLIEK